MSLQLFRRKLSPLWRSSKTCYQNRCYFCAAYFCFMYWSGRAFHGEIQPLALFCPKFNTFFSSGSSNCRLKTWMSLSWNIYIHSNIASCRLRRCVIRFVFSSNCHEIVSRFKSFIICVNVAISCFGIQGTKFENMPQKLYTFKIF